MGIIVILNGWYWIRFQLLIPWGNKPLLTILLGPIWRHQAKMVYEGNFPNHMFKFSVLTIIRSLFISMQHWILKWVKHCFLCCLHCSQQLSEVWHSSPTKVSISTWVQHYIEEQHSNSSKTTLVFYLYSTHWGWDKLATILPVKFSYSFSWVQITAFWFQFHWSLFLIAKVTCNYLHWWWPNSLGIEELI